jgi:hypothetical protein
MRFPAMNRRGERAMVRRWREAKKRKGRGNSSRLSLEYSGRNIPRLTAATIPMDKQQNGRSRGGSRNAAFKSPSLFELVLKRLYDVVQLFRFYQ